MKLYIQLIVMVVFFNSINSIKLYNTYYISGDGFRSMADHIFDERSTMRDGSKVQCGDIVFVRSHKLDLFFKQIHPTISQRYILITHNMDDDAPGLYRNYLDDEKILRWFGKNPSIIGHEKFITIPIGIANRECSYGKEESFTQSLKLKTFGRKYLLGFNFSTHTMPTDRVPTLQYCLSLPYARNLRNKKHVKYLYNMRLAKYIISPPGAGLDCHRTWEAMIMGAIPVVLSSPLDPLLTDLPVLIINNWTEINQQLLKDRYDSLVIKFTHPSMQKLTYDYWYHVVKGYQRQIKNIAC